MLSCDQIITALDASHRTGKRLSVIPEPMRAGILDRGATSLDLRLGRWFRSFKQTHTAVVSLAPPDVEEASNDEGIALYPDDDGESGRIASSLKTKQHFIPFGKPFVIHPGSFVLGATLEWLNIPKNISAYVTGKSSLGRRGLIIETSAGIHPGFSGCLTLELANVGEMPLQIEPGMKVCQIFFHSVRPSKISNPGAASGQRKPALPKLRFDRTFSRIREGVA